MSLEKLKKEGWFDKDIQINPELTDDDLKRLKACEEIIVDFEGKRYVMEVKAKADMSNLQKDDLSINEITPEQERDRYEREIRRLKNQLREAWDYLKNIEIRIVDTTEDLGRCNFKHVADSDYGGHYAMKRYEEMHSALTECRHALSEMEQYRARR